MIHATRRTLSWLILAALLVGCMILCIQGCAPATVPPPSLESASTRLDVIREEAEQIVREAKAGEAAVPAAKQRFNSIALGGESIVKQAGEARSEVGVGQKQLAEAIAQINQLRSEQNHLLDLVRLGGTLAIPLAVFVGLWSGRYKFALALGVAGAVAIAIASVVGKLAAVWPWVGGALALAIVWLGVETGIRMARGGLSFADAVMRSVRTPPWQDLQDLFPAAPPPPVP